VLDRLNTELGGEAFIQELEDADGATINMDLFEATVPLSALPEGMTPEAYLEHIRTNINDFIDTDISRFGPYDDLPGEWDRWTSSNPLGTVLTIDFFGPGPLNLQDGSVVSIVNTPDQWVFGTVYTPNDGYHPVSGNRQFGVRTNDNGTATIKSRMLCNRVLTRSLDYAARGSGVVVGSGSASACSA